MKATDFFDISSDWIFSKYFSLEVVPWEWLKHIAHALESLDWGMLQTQTLPLVQLPSALSITGKVFIHPTVKLPTYGCIQGPAYIGAHTELRPGVYIRGNVIVGEKCVLGNSCEYKNCILLDNVQTPHYNYVGDSILGNHAHLGAGAILSNFRLDGQKVKVKINEKTINTDLRKFGAVLGDYAQAGCNAVLQPGTLLGKHSAVHPCVGFGGYLPPKAMARLPQSSHPIIQ